MANVTVTNTFVSGTTASASEVNQDFTDLTTWLNNRDNASDSWLNVKVTATVANPVIISSSAATTEVSIDNTATDGDPMISWKLSGTAKFSMGIDDSDSDKWKLSKSGALGSSDYITTDGTAAIVIPALGGLSVELATAGSTSIVYIIQTDNSNGNSHAEQLVRSGGASGGDAFTNYNVSGVTNFAVGIDNSDSDRFKIAATATLGTTDVLTCTTTASVIVGNAAIATNATDGFLYIAGGAGAPSGTPTAFTGRYPLYWNTTNKKLYIYDGSWIGGTAPGAWS